MIAIAIPAHIVRVCLQNVFIADFRGLPNACAIAAVIVFAIVVSP
jgi:hypothetical protein